MVRLLALAGVAAVLAAPVSAARAPSLKIVQTSPLVVRGLSFHARETVTVTAPIGRLRLRTTATGAFLATFRSGTDHCTGGRIVAVGAAGDQVVLRLPQTMCLPASSAASSG